MTQSLIARTSTAGRHPLHRRVLAAVLGLLLAVAGLVATDHAATAATATTCGYATPGTGTYARTLCWFDMSGYNTTSGKFGGQAMELGLPGGWTLNFTMHQSLDRNIVPTPFPSFSGAWLGSSGYGGVPGRPALYQATGSTSTTVWMDDIALTDPNGNPSTAFAIVGADAEATDAGESIVFTSDKPMRQIAPLGNACPAGLTGLGTTTVTCSSDNIVRRTGGAMLAADAPTTMTQQMVTTQRQAVAFGVLLSKVQLSKSVSSRVSPNDTFDVNVVSPDGATLRTASTGTGNTATTGEVETIGGNTSSPFILNETSSGDLDMYSHTWSCTRNGTDDPSLPAGEAGTSNQVTLGIGDFVDCRITNTALPAALTLEKIAGPVVDVNGNGVRDEGDTIHYTFEVTNSGALDVQNIAVNDPKIGAVTCPRTTLAVGASMVCSADALHTFTAADVAAGAFTNTATATGAPAGGSEITSNSSATTTRLESPAAALTLTKSVTPATAAAPGDTVTYHFLVTNTGNVDVRTLSIAETSFSGTGSAPVPVCPVTALAPGTSTTCTAAYTVTQADFDAGSVRNTAHATGTDTGGLTVTSPDASATLTATPAPAIALEKSVSPDDAASFVVGQELTYSFVATNTGSVTLTGVGISEQSFSGTGGAVAPVCPASAPVPPGGQVTCTATYTLTQADIDNGEVTNTATAHGTPPSGAAVSSTPSTVAVPGNPAPALAIQKSATPTTVSAAGDVVTYRFVVTNTGNVTIKNVAVDEVAFSGTGGAPAVSCPAEAATLFPGARVVCTADYALTPADADQSQLTNTATATGTPPASAGGPVTSTTSTATVAIAENPALELVKTANPLQATAAGDVITYSFAVTNTGDTTVNGITIAEGSFSGTGSAPAPTCPAGAAALAPGATVTCTATYTVTQADADAGRIANSATAGGTTPSGAGVTSSESDNVVPVTPDASVTLQKLASVPNVTAAGQTITYSFVVRNTGNVTLLSSDIIETRFTGDLSALRPVCPPGITSIAPGASITCTAEYVVTQADMDAGSIENIATLSGKTPSGDPITTPPSRITVTAQASPALEVRKTADPTFVTAAGQPVTYSYLITNTGNVTLTDVTAAEGEFTGTGPLPSVTCPAAAASLAPGASVTCTAPYRATQADVDAGTVTNTATATGTPPGGATPVDSPPSSTTFSAVAKPDLTIAKTANPSTITKSGQTVTYSFVVTNTGNVTMSDVAVIEGTFTGTGIAPVVDCPAGPIILAPGDTVTCTATYTSTLADVDAGGVDNTATVQGTTLSAPDDPISFGPAQSRFDAPAQPALSIVKSASPSDAASFVPGADIAYAFVVTNTGNVTMDSVEVAETAFSGSGPTPVPDCSTGPTTLAPGDQLVCVATYTVTQADADAGGITNTAEASGLPPAGGERIVSEPSTVALPHDSAPALELVKTATVTGSAIGYRFAVTNTGNVTVADVAIVEGAFSGTGGPPAVDCPKGGSSLAPGEAIVCVAHYSFTDADRRAGSVTNTATASGSTGAGPLSSDPSTARAALPGLGGLASTGSSVDAIVWAAVALLLVGGAAFGLVAVRRRRAR